MTRLQIAFITLTGALLAGGLSLIISGCSVKEEVRRIEEVKKAERRQAASLSTDLTGEQVFIRSCNTCHPGGRKGVGPALDKINEQFKSDSELKKFIRAGKGMMPPQTKEIVNDEELNNLVVYLRSKT